MSREVVQVAAGIGLVAVAVALAAARGLGLERSIAVAAARAGLQLAVVGALIALVFRVPALAVAFVAVMVASAALTSGRHQRALPGARVRALVAIAVPALAATGLLVAVGAFALTSRAIVPTAGILIGGAMTATTLTARRLLEGLEAEREEIETRLCLGDGVREATAPTARRAIRTGLVPAIDQTRSAGLVTLPGTFVGLVLGGASPAEAAATQLVVLLALLAVELVAGVLVSELLLRRVAAPGERLRELPTRVR